MVARNSHCPRHQLQHVLIGTLPADQTDSISLHLQSCTYCQSELEALAGGDEWWQHAKVYLSTNDDLLRPGPGDPSSWTIDALSDEDETVDLPADFLQVSDDPASLGKLGPYEIESVIGRGGMGIVLKARDPALNRLVAIKVLSRRFASSAAARRRFTREAQAAAAVVHDHVIPIHSVGTVDSTTYLVMPLVGGRSLQDRLDAVGVLQVSEILRIAMQTASGLAAAHAQGIVHRDVKPANILLENDVDRVRITDFGLARAVDDASQTQSGFIAGTPQYMAPEQARGEAIDARADLFSLGSVMYAMCTGHPPFRAETTLAVLRRICDDTPRDVRESNPDVPRWLAAIVHRLLAKSPDDRYSSAAEVAALLERWLAHLQQPTLIPRPDPLEPTRRRWRRVLIPVVLLGIAPSIIVTLTMFGVLKTSRNSVDTDRRAEERSSRAAPASATYPSASTRMQEQRQPNALAKVPVVMDSWRAEYDTIDHEIESLRRETSRLCIFTPVEDPNPGPLFTQEIQRLESQLDAIESGL